MSGMRRLGGARHAGEGRPLSPLHAPGRDAIHARSRRLLVEFHRRMGSGRCRRAAGACRGAGQRAVGRTAGPLSPRHSRAVRPGGLPDRPDRRGAGRSTASAAGLPAPARLAGVAAIASSTGSRPGPRRPLGGGRKLVALGPEAVATALDRFTTAGNGGELPSIPQPIVHALADVGPEATDALGQALGSPKPGVRAAAADVLSENGRPGQRREDGAGGRAGRQEQLGAVVCRRGPGQHGGRGGLGGPCPPAAAGAPGRLDPPPRGRSPGTDRPAGQGGRRRPAERQPARPRRGGPQGRRRRLVPGRSGRSGGKGEAADPDGGSAN